MSRTNKVEQTHKHRNLTVLSSISLLAGFIIAGIFLWIQLKPLDKMRYDEYRDQEKNQENENIEPEIIIPIKTPLDIENEELGKLVDNFRSSQPAEFYLYIENLKTGALYKNKSDEMVPSGSIYKMFLANQVYRLNEAGKLDMNTPVKGIGLSFQNCTARMVRDSYNACGEAVRTHLGAVEQTKDLQKQGYTCTSLMHKEAAHTCANDVALLYTRLYNGGYFSRAHTEEFLGYLKNQMWTFRIPEGLPRAPVIAGNAGWRSKTGDVYAFANDSAIIVGENTDYIIVILSGPWKTVFPDSSYAIRHLSGLVYNLMNGTQHKLNY